MLTWKYSWRNIWRNRRRSMITLVALALNTAILIATFALVTGYIQNSVQYITNLNFGEVQIHAPEYLEDNSIYKTIDNPDDIIEAAESHGISAAPRVYGYGLLSSGNKSAGVQFQGVVPKLEMQTFTLSQHMMSGEFLSEEYRTITAENDEGETREYAAVVLGKRLAKTLDAEVGTELVAVVQASDGSLGTDLYRVAGILKSAGDKIDRSTVFMYEEDFRQLFVMPENVHEIVLNSHGAMQSEEVKSTISDYVPGLDVRTWQELNPTMAKMIEQSHVSFGILAAIFFIVAGLGIMNTMLMATFDRIREFGVLKALGATPSRILMYVLTEAFLMGSLATLIGLVVGILGTIYLEVYGIDTSSLGTDISWGGIAFDPVWKAKMTTGSIAQPVILMWIISVAAAVYPALIAAKLKPVDAMHHV